MFYDLSKAYNKYAYDVVNGNILACKTIKQVCERYISWFEKEDRYFDTDDVDRKIRFVYKLKHSTGKHAGHNFELLPWQQFAFAYIFGWKYKDTKLRIVHNAFIFIVRKNGKSALAAALALATLLVDNEQGAEIDIVANSSKQAQILFDMCRNFAESIDPQSKIFQRFRSDIKVPLTKSLIQVHSSDSMTLDGYNSSVGIFDEVHAAKDWNLYNVLQSSQGMREQPLMLCITTSGFLVGEEYPCYSMYSTGKRLLDGDIEDDSFFPLIYELDADDDWHDESKWIKCCPSLGQTVTETYMENQVKAATNNPLLEVGVKTKNFNYFMQSSETWLSIDDINKVTAHVDLNDFTNNDDVYSIGSIDLSEVDDLTVYTLLLVKDEMLYFKCYPFIPLRALENSTNKDLYRNWIKNGYLNLINEEVIDLEVIENKIIELDNIVPVTCIGYDPYKCRQLALKFSKQGLPMRVARQGLSHFTEPTKEFSRLVYQKQLVIDDNPVIKWNLMNAKLKYDANGNCKPIKELRANKIDCVITMIQATNLYMELNGIITAADLDPVILK